MKNIFTGVKVIDITKVFSGPFATRMLADYGADVLKIESEINPDDSRHYPPLKNNWSGYFEILNRNKYSISLNLKDESDLKNLYNLINEADVFVENLTPSTKHKLKVDYETLKSINPKLIYASLSGVGQDADTKYYDVIAQAQSGLMSLSGQPKQPMKIGPSVVDAFSGMTLAFGIASALFYRQTTGIGQYIDVSMLSCSMNLLENNLIDYSLTNQLPQPAENHDTAISPFGVYKANDGYLVVAAGNDSLWQKLATFLKQKRPLDDSVFSTNTLRLQHNIRLTTLIEDIFSNYTVNELEQTLSSLGIPCSKVYTMADVANDEQNFKRKALYHFQHTKLGTCIVPGTSITFSACDPQPITQAPEIGEDNTTYGL